MIDAEIAPHQLALLHEWYWPCWIGMNWGFRKHAAVYWCCIGEVSPAKAALALGISVTESFEAVVFYREFVRSGLSEVDIANTILSVMPEAERKHISRFVAGSGAFERGKSIPRSIAQMIDEVAEPTGLVPLMMADDSVGSKIPGARMVFDGLRRNYELFSGAPMKRSTAPVLFISSECPQLNETIPALQEDKKVPELIASIGTEQDDIWQACLNTYTQYPLVRSGTPVAVLRSEYINRALTPTGRHINHLKFDEDNRGVQRRGRKR